jgi:hypothetical protein
MIGGNGLQTENIASQDNNLTVWTANITNASIVNHPTGFGVGEVFDVSPRHKSKSTANSIRKWKAIGMNICREEWVQVLV